VCGVGTKGYEEGVIMLSEAVPEGGDDGVDEGEGWNVVESGAGVALGVDEAAECEGCGST
jgi:hypothetical protein